MIKLKRKKAFTIIELIVVIAIIGILVLIGLPKLTGYVEKTQLARIKHDVKIMENIMEDELARNFNVNYEGFDNNGKDLGKLVLNHKLFEKEGYAKNVQYVLKPGEIGAIASNKRLEYNKELAMGGPVVIPAGESAIDSNTDGYKIIPEEYKVKAGSTLKGTFYSNETSKVYYESDKPLSKEGSKTPIACSQIPLPDYTFEHEIGKIVKYHGTEQHLIIPDYFLVDGQCWPVRIIGKAAFMQGGFRSISEGRKEDTSL